MMEMRWYTREGLTFRNTEGDEWKGVGIRTLQYRVFRTHRIDGDHAVKLLSWSDDYGWSDWMDVPEVHEGSDAASRRVSEDK